MCVGWVGGRGWDRHSLGSCQPLLNFPNAEEVDCDRFCLYCYGGMESGVPYATVFADSTVLY